VNQMMHHDLKKSISAEKIPHISVKTGNIPDHNRGAVHRGKRYNYKITMLQVASTRIYFVF
jgi:hypothetical protein